ncbi:hypothetical protein [Pseudomonas inefficax]|uniref:hypothetical protein n=1 Tax=Pseudomonas inefficax TaxID=2078786 RepID=UPI0040469DBC
MKWITALQLEQWADAVQSRAQIPGLVAALIWATASRVRRLRFPQGDRAQIRGFDGYLDVDSSSPFLPDGRSIWEFGTSGAGKAKAEKDYRSRTAEVAPSERANTTLVLVTPRSWDTAKEKVEDWLAEKNSQKDWKQVVYLEGIQLEEWLYKCPAVASRWARYELGIAPQAGACSTDEFWQSFSTRFQPAIAEDVLLAGRERQAEELLQQLTQPSGRLAYSADSTDEVIAFTVAAIRKASETVRSYLESRTLIVDTAEAANILVSTSNLIYLPRSTARDVSGLLMLRGPTVVSAGTDEKKHGHTELRRPTSRELGAAFAKMGMSDEEGYEAARRCGRSLAVFARQYPSGTAEKPKWLDDLEPLVPVMLAGAWVADIDHDKAILASLSQQDYDDTEDGLRKYLYMPDSPLECVGNLWATRAPVDAFLHLAPYVGRRQIQLFKEAVIKVFSATAQAHKPPSPDEPYVFQGMQERAASHSEHLRNGLMTTLLQMAVLDVPGFKPGGEQPQLFVDKLINSVPGLLSDHRLMASLGQDLALLAEASPQSFLNALERQLEGPEPTIQPIFDEFPGMLTPVTYHTGLLWALEVLAWDPVFFDRAVLCLAKLAEIDPGGRLSNRPINSLRAIFLSWLPSTGVTTKRRLAVLEFVLRQVQSIAWPLLEKLLPKSGDTSSSTARPKFREYEELTGEALTFGSVWESEAKIVELAMNEAGVNPARWSSLIDSLPNLQDATFSMVVKRLGDAIDSAPSSTQIQIWKTLHRQVKRHQKYSSFDWSMPSERLNPLSLLVEKYEPTEISESCSWLFDDWMPPVDGSEAPDADPIQVVETARLNALGKVLESAGIDGVLELMTQVKHPRLVCRAFRGLNLSYSQLRHLLMSLLNSQVPELELALGFVVADGIFRFGKRWEDEIHPLLQGSSLVVAQVARVFELLPEHKETWGYIASFGGEVERSYWANKTPYQIDASQDDLVFAVKKYRLVGRPSAALTAISRRLAEIATDDVVALLKENVTEQNEKPENQTASSFFEVEKVLEDLAKRPDIKLHQLAALEFLYLPVLHEDPRALHRMLLEHPDFFMEMVCKVFRAKDEEPSETSEQEQKHASNAYRLLKSLKNLPGQSEQQVEESALLAWCVEVRRLADNANRKDITDQIIGQVLAHAPVSSVDGAWPHEAVRSVIEKLASTQLERGISIERINMRGVYSKAIGEGGDQERELAHQVREWAKASSESVRTRAMLEEIATSWDKYAELADTHAEQQALRF